LGVADQSIRGYAEGRSNASNSGQPCGLVLLLDPTQRLGPQTDSIRELNLCQSRSASTPPKSWQQNTWPSCEDIYRESLREEGLNVARAVWASWMRRVEARRELRSIGTKSPSRGGLHGEA
jgi:hypothetical protein